MLDDLHAQVTVEARFDRPFQEAGIWWIDLVLEGRETSLSWQDKVGFGVYTDAPEFGGRPDEIYVEAERAACRLLQLAAQQRRGDGVHSLNLRELRHLVGEPQTAIAQALGSDQAGVSRLERRNDIKLSTLEKYLQAMGGELEIRVRFPDFAAPLSPGEGRKARKETEPADAA